MLVDCRTYGRMCNSEACVQIQSEEEGNFKLLVHDDHNNDLCDVLLVKSADKSCSKISVGHEASHVILNHNSDNASQVRLANNIGFKKDVNDIFCLKNIGQE